jgi:hypothetical protein
MLRDGTPTLTHLQQTASKIVKDFISKWGEKQGSEPGLTPEIINEGYCSEFAHSVVRAIQKDRGRDVGEAGKHNDTDDVHTSRVGPNENGDGHLWITVEGRHYDAESPEGITDPKELKWFSRHATVHPKFMPNV